jgi:hypothetical protein
MIMNQSETQRTQLAALKFLRDGGMENSSEGYGEAGGKQEGIQGEKEQHV